jgi:hypothetical protein
MCQRKTESKIMERMPPQYETHLIIDALYFHSACHANLQAKASIGEIMKAEKVWRSLEEAEQEIHSRYERNACEEYEKDISSSYDELEPIYIQMEDAHYQIGEAYAPLIKEIAVVHILCVATLEAHINAVASETLKAKNRNQFERLALEAKWLFLPKILGYHGFDPGRQPYQRFSNLLKYRNELVHYKGIKEEWVYGAAPQFLLKIGLTIEQSQQSIECTEEMVRELCQMRGVEPPFWLRNDINNMSYFEFTISR